MCDDELTLVDLIWVEKQAEHWVRFGRQASDRIVDRRRRVVGFAPDAVFALVRWAANDYGTVRSRIDIVQAVRPGAAYTTLSSVRPGGDILLTASGWPKVEQVLRAIDAVETAGIDPCDAAPDHWRHLHNRIAGGLVPHLYTSARHRVWLLRREIAA